MRTIVKVKRFGLENILIEYVATYIAIVDIEINGLD